MTAIIDGAAVRSREELHDALSRELLLPDWYGRNLDALRDCLTDPRKEEVFLRVLRGNELKNTLGPYADAFFRVLRDSESDFFHFNIIL